MKKDKKIIYLLQAKYIAAFIFAFTALLCGITFSVTEFSPTLARTAINLETNEVKELKTSFLETDLNSQKLVIPMIFFTLAFFVVAYSIIHHFKHEKNDKK